MEYRTPEDSAAAYQAANAHGMNKYMEGLRKSFEIYRRIVLPPRGARGSRSNQKRAFLLQAALHQSKWPKGTRCERKKKFGRCRMCTAKITWRKKNAAPETAHVKPRGPANLYASIPE